MSTRCQIGFYDSGDREDLDKFKTLIYRHSDGYPSGVLPLLLPFCRWWNKVRGLSDYEYASARFLQYACNEYDGESIENIEGKPSSGLTGLSGYGISNDFHGDIEFFYAVDKFRIEVYAMDWDDACGEQKSFRLLWSVEVKDIPESVDAIMEMINKQEEVLNG
jgi:hypothetical protein